MLYHDILSHFSFDHHNKYVYIYPFLNAGRAQIKYDAMTAVDISESSDYIYLIVWRINKAGHVDPPRFRAEVCTSCNVLTANQFQLRIGTSWKLLSVIGALTCAFQYIFSRSPYRQNCYEQYAFLLGGLPPPKRNTELLRFHVYLKKPSKDCSPCWAIRSDINQISPEKESS